MRVLAVLLALAALVPVDGWARPQADVVIVWAPGFQLAPLEAAAREAGAAVIDRSPVARAPFQTAGLVRRGITAYDALQLGDAARLLDEARAEVDRSGGAEVTQIELSDLFLYRGLVKHQQGDATAAWDELVIAMTVAPTRALDPARFPPRVAAELERVRTTLAARPKVNLAVDAPAGCVVSIDGVGSGGVATPRLVGAHFANVRCPDRAPWGAHIDLIADATLTARNPVLVPPSRAELLIQARTAGARAFVVVEVIGTVGTARLVGLDGRERDRRTANVTRTLEPLAAALRELLVPVRERRWYQSRWAWAAGAAVLAAAIFVPLTAVVAGDAEPTTWSGQFEGATW